MSWSFYQTIQRYSTCSSVTLLIVTTFGFPSTDSSCGCGACRYGELQGLNKKETADKFGADKVHEWRRSYDIPPPNGESLEMCAERAVKYFVDKVLSLVLLRVFLP